MPAGDRTGPSGMGPRTGRAAGYCSGYATPGFANRGMGGGFGFGRGMGRGFGFGRGMGRGFGRGYGLSATVPYATPYAPPQGYAPPTLPTREQELEMLNNQAVDLKQGLKEINQRITELESKAKEK